MADIDQTIDDLFQLYLTQGKTELFEEMCPYFGILWPAGRVLGELLATRDPESSYRIEKGRVLEVGCGLALPSLVLAKLKIEVTAMDLHPDVHRFLMRNCSLNSVKPFEFVEADWSQWSFNEQWDTIIASDVLYDRAQPEPLLRFFQRSLSSKGRAIVSDPGRGYWSGFLERAQEMSMDTGWRVSSRGVFGVNTCVIAMPDFISKEKANHAKASQ